MRGRGRERERERGRRGSLPCSYSRTVRDEWRGETERINTVGLEREN